MLRNYFTGFCLLLSICSCQKSKHFVLPENNDYLIEFDEFEKLLGYENIKIIDFRKPEEYTTDHIVGAINIWRPEIRSESYPYSGMMASREEVQSLFREKGIRNDDVLIVYDDKGLCDAARLWWILQIYDHHQIQMLNGSYSTWKTSHEVTSEVSEITPSHFSFQNKPSHTLHISKDEVQKVSGHKLILDTRTDDEYTGKRQKKGSYKAGHIPNAIQIDWANAINYHGDKKFKSTEELKEIYKEVLAYSDDTVITYCQSGTRSAHTTFVLTQLLGMKNVKNYDGSWIEWSYFNDLPFEKDSITTIFE